MSYIFQWWLAQNATFFGLSLTSMLLRSHWMPSRFCLVRRNGIITSLFPRIRGPMLLLLSCLCKAIQKPLHAPLHPCHVLCFLTRPCMSSAADQYSKRIKIGAYPEASWHFLSCSRLLPYDFLAENSLSAQESFFCWLCYQLGHPCKHRQKRQASAPPSCLLWTPLFWTVTDESPKCMLKFCCTFLDIDSCTTSCFPGYSSSVQCRRDDCTKCGMDWGTRLARKSQGCRYFTISN